MIVGFTGTREGFNSYQKNEFVEIIKLLKPKIFIHGDCIGCDTEAHAEIQKLQETLIHIRPCDISNQRAFNSGAVQFDPERPLKRNVKIVESSDIVIAIPKLDEEELRSGTWQAIRTARKLKKPLIIIFPTKGNYKMENFNEDFIS